MPSASGAWSTSGILALIGSVVALGLAIGYIADFHSGGRPCSTSPTSSGSPTLGIHYKLGVSGLNVFLVGLTTLLFAAATLAANLRSWERPKLFYFHFMLAESAVLGAFLAQDLALFVAFFDLMLIPFYFLIGGWGREPDRVKATIKLVIYTLVGSLLMLAAAIATGVLAAEQGGGHITFVLTSLQALPLSKGSQEWIFLFFAAAFLVKMPAFPLHGWMPDGYRAMPIEVLMVFSGVLSKVGAYGFLAIVLPLFPQAAAHFQMLMLLIALASILYGSALAFTPDRRAPDRRVLLGRAARLHHARDLRPEPPGRPGRAAADGQPRARRRAAVLHHPAALPPRRRLGGHPRDGRHRLPRAGARLAVPDRRARDARDARLVELRRRVPDPARRLQSQARDRGHRLQRRGDGERVRAAAVHRRDAQPRRAEGRLP